MKRLAVVLMIMIISLTAVYAENTSKEVQITYIVSEFFIPDFQIRYNGNDVTGSSVQMTNPEENVHGIVEGESSKFSLVDLTQANTTGTLEFGVSVSNQWKGSEDNLLYGSLSIKEFSVNTDSTDNAVAEINPDLANSVLVSYPGSVVDRLSYSTEIASFIVGWNNAPNAPAQQYSATITVTCSTK